MTISYLIVTQWQGGRILHTNDSLTFGLVKRVNAQGKKARELAYSYATELNGGIDYSILSGRENLIKALRHNLTRYTVCAIPASQAREYNNYLSWEDCEIYKVVR